MECFIASIPRRKGEKFLLRMARALASETEVSNVLPFRPASEQAAVQRARREAVELFRQLLPTFMARLR